MPAWWEKLKSNVGLQEDQETGTQSLLSQLDEATTLSKTQRLIGFAACFGLGLLLTFLSPMFLFRPTKFAVIYTLGNLLSIGGSMFLMGPWKQIKTMFDGKRAISTVIYLAAIMLTLVSAWTLQSVVLCMVLIVVQFAAFLWYCLSYVPFAQAMVLRMFGREAVEG